MSESTTPPSPADETSGEADIHQAEAAPQGAVAVAGSGTPVVTSAVTLNGNTPDLSVLSRSQRQLLDDLRGSSEVLLLLRTGSSVDTGNWLRAGRIYLAVTDEMLLLFADGKRPVASSVAFSELAQSLYNHVTGKLVLAPAPEVAVKAVALNPDQARLVLHLTGAKESPDV